MKEPEMYPLVSVGIPFFNAEKYIVYSIISVIKQTYENWELILLDDGSTDNSLEIALDFEKKDKRIRVISNGKNLGLPTRLNEISKLASGKFYARMDADDIMHPERLETQVNYLNQNPNVDLLATGLISIDNFNNIIGKRKGNINQSEFSYKDLVTQGGWCAHPTIMGKSSWFKKNRYDEKLTRTEDYDLWLRTIGSSNFCKIDSIGLYYREESTPTLKKYLFSSRQLLTLFSKHKKALGLRYYYILCVKTISKSLIYIFFTMIGKKSILISRRSSKLGENELEWHKKVLNKVIK